MHVTDETVRIFVDAFLQANLAARRTVGLKEVRAGLEAVFRAAPRVEVPGVDPDLIAECLRDYAAHLENGTIDGAGRYLPEDIYATADAVENIAALASAPEAGR